MTVAVQLLTRAGRYLTTAVLAVPGPVLPEVVIYNGRVYVRDASDPVPSPVFTEAHSMLVHETRDDQQRTTL